ncbi:hypothetical protein [Rhizobium sp. Root1220]|uniref:hypothetical protein n=1 Tax=Rhizobium sp. Root1220 TaxID=1736432 RepID=UPI0006FFD692|nr:hypothetical protein [Rhizobium sp. Root1220]KQV78169.1 hypothetical protein ASC90_26965 [Rhizobium sp. Root1220]
MSFKKTAKTGLIAATLAIASIVVSTPAMAYGYIPGGDGGAIGGDFSNGHRIFSEHTHGFAGNTTQSSGRLSPRAFHRFNDNGWDTCYPDWRHERHADTFQNECY